MQRIALKNFEDVTVLKFLQSLALDFPYICLSYRQMGAGGID